MCWANLILVHSNHLVIYQISTGNIRPSHLREKHRKCDISTFTRQVKWITHNQGGRRKFVDLTMHIIRCKCTRSNDIIENYSRTIGIIGQMGYKCSTLRIFPNTLTFDLFEYSLVHSPQHPPPNNFGIHNSKRPPSTTAIRSCSLLWKSLKLNICRFNVQSAALTLPILIWQ